jgi:cation diffusion facilitator CzcD-associated flavoprotein CzcO
MRHCGQRYCRSAIAHQQAGCWIANTYGVRAQVHQKPFFGIVSRFVLLLCTQSGLNVVNSEQPDVLVVGAGFAGMYAIYRFRELGLKIKVLEAGSDVGGTWYWNRYPGARCDVPSLEYSFGFSPELEQEWHWPEVFSAQPDILNYANHIADTFDLRRDIQFDTRVASVRYLDDENLWQLTTEAGELLCARYCIMATGCLSVPNKPSIAGDDSFSGLVLHTGSWPHEPVDLSDKRVGVIGTGSSGVQAIPELAKQAGHLTVFQRTPVYTVPANRKPMREAVENEFKDNYRDIRERQWNNRGGVSAFRPTRSVAASAPRGESGGRPGDAGLIKPLSPEARQALIDARGLGAILNFADVYTDTEANEIANDLFKDNVRKLIDDPITAEKLLPKDYGLGCKRQVLDRDYYVTFNRDNVEIVDLMATPIESITPNGIKTSEADFDVDVLIYATGFDAMTGALLKADVTGREGCKLKDKWEDGPVAYLGLQMSGFPNLFTITGPGSPSVLCNMLVAIEQHVNWVGDCITYLKERGIDAIEPSTESETRWIAHVNEVAEGTMFTAPSCNSWYLGANIEGKPRIFMPYVGGFPQYRSFCEEEKNQGYPGFNLLRT